MSKFWGGDSSSDDDDDDGDGNNGEKDNDENDDDFADDDEFDNAAAPPKSAAADGENDEDGDFKRNTKYLGDDSDSDAFDDHSQRVMRSGAQKFAHLVRTHTATLRTALPALDFISAQSAFDALEKATLKRSAATLSVGFVSTVRAVLAISQAQQKKKLEALASKAQARACLALMKAAKACVANHAKSFKGVDVAVAPDVWGEYDDLADDDDDDDDGDDDDDDDGEQMAGDDADVDDKVAPSKPKQNKWFAADDDDDDGGEDDDDGDKAARRKRRLVQRAAAAAAAKGDKPEGGKSTKAGNESLRASVATTVDDSGAWDEARVERTVRDLLARRSARPADRQAANWRKLLVRAAQVSPRAELLVLSHTVSSEFDTTTALGAPMKQTVWRDAVIHTARILQLVQAHAGTLTLVGDGDAADADATDFAVGDGSLQRGRALLGASMLEGAEEEKDDADGSSSVAGSEATSSVRADTTDAASVAASSTVSESAPLVIGGNLGAMLERIDFEWVKAVQASTSASPEYVARLRDEPVMLKLASDVHAYYARIGATRRASLLAELVLDHLYFRTHDVKLFGAVRDAASSANEETGDFSRVWMAGDHTERVRALARFVYAHGAERGKTRVLLMSVFHDAANGRYSEARDQLLMSYTQETIQHADISTMVLFNRAMARLGVAAFENGLISEAHSCLAELYGGHVRELLAQGTASRYGERTVEQERAEQQRQIPYHMWLNLDLLDAVHIVCALLLEVPNMALHEHGDGGKRRVISRAFRRQLDYAERQVFSGPPESARDHALVAARALKRGDWRECVRLLDGLQAWTLLRDAASVRAMLGRVIRREALRTYLLRFASAYESLSLAQLAAQFDLAEAETHAIVSRMMTKDELAASWDQPTQCVIMQGTEPTRLQGLALQFAERASTFVENNERLFDARTGGHAFSDAEKEKQRERERGGGPKFRGGPKHIRGGANLSRGGSSSGGRRGGASSSKNVAAAGGSGSGVKVASSSSTAASIAVHSGAKAVPAAPGKTTFTSKNNK